MAANSPRHHPFSSSVNLSTGATRRSSEPNLSCFSRFFRRYFLVQPPAEGLPHTYAFQTALGRRFQAYYWERFFVAALLWLFLAQVAIFPYLELSFAPIDKMKEKEKQGELSSILSWLLESGFLYFAAFDSTFVNGVALYPKQTLDLLFKIWHLIYHAVQGRLHLPVFTSQSMKKNVFYGIGVPLAFVGIVTAAYFAGQVFRNAMAKSTTAPELFVWGMVICRISIVFSAMVNLLFKFIINPLMGITVLRKQIDAMIGVIMAESKQSLKESSTDRPAERQRFKKAQACLLAVENIVEWVARLRVYILYEEWFRAKMSGAGGADSPSCWKKFAKMTGSFAQLMRGLLFGALVITISFLATIGQWGGVMAFYDNWVAGSLALLAVFFLYCDSVYKALKGIFSRHSYDKKDIELILKQIFSFLVGFFSGLPSTAVVMAASQDEQHNLFNGEEISAAQIFFTYLNGALLNGMFCFAAVTTLMWFLNMFQGSFSREPTQGYGDAGAYPRAVDLVFGEFMKRVCAIVSDFNLRPEERERIETILRTTNPHKIEDAFGWEREVPSWEDRSPSRTEETPMQAGGERTPLLGERLVQLGMTARSFPHAVLVLGNPRRERQEEVVDEEIVHEDIDMGAEWAV